MVMSDHNHQADSASGSRSQEAGSEVIVSENSVTVPVVTSNGEENAGWQTQRSSYRRTGYAEIVSRGQPHNKSSTRNTSLERQNPTGANQGGRQNEPKHTFSRKKCIRIRIRIN